MDIRPKLVMRSCFPDPPPMPIDTGMIDTGMNSCWMCHADYSRGNDFQEPFLIFQEDKLTTNGKP